jgi:hypothetical protein
MEASLRTTGDPLDAVAKGRDRVADETKTR